VSFREILGKSDERISLATITIHCPKVEGLLCMDAVVLEHKGDTESMQARQHKARNVELNFEFFSDCLTAYVQP
jgi:hypothetical protein